MDFYKRALALREETISHRRWLHSNAEVGLHMPKGQTYVMEQLRGYGLVPQFCGHGGSYLRPRFPCGHAADSGKDIKRK